MASNKEIRSLIEEIDKVRKLVRNSKLKLKRRIKRLEKTSNPLERARVEFEIEMLKGKIRRWEILESKLNIPIMKAMLSGEKLEYAVDWSKAGRA